MLALGNVAPSPSSPSKQGGVLTSRLVDGLIEIGNDVKLVEDIQGLARIATNCF